MVSSLECFICFFVVVLFFLYPLQVLDIPSEDSFTHKLKTSIVFLVTIVKQHFLRLNQYFIC